MMEWIRSLPVLPAVGILYVVILLRAGATYAIGRGAGRLADRGRLATLRSSPRVQRAQEAIHRWGAPVVALSFLTVGFQTAANAAAGLSRMPLRRYLPALAVGGLAWAVLYATVGLAAVFLWIDLFLASPWAAIAALLLVSVIIVLVVRRRRRQEEVAASTAPPKRRSRRA